MSENNRYLGDGVYASFDGWQFWLSADHHENRVVALEDQVLNNFFRYVESVYQVKITVEKLGGRES